MNIIVKKYKFVICVLVINLIMLIVYPDIGKKSLLITFSNLPYIIFNLIPIFILIGLLDAWIDRGIMIRLIGENSGIRGILVAFFLGMVTAVPLYSLLPIAGILLKKEAKLSNVLIFLCSCTNIRIPLLLFEISSMGWRFSFIRFIINIIVVIIIAFIIEKILSEKEKKFLYEQAKMM